MLTCSILVEKIFIPKNKRNLYMLNFNAKDTKNVFSLDKMTDISNNQIKVLDKIPVLHLYKTHIYSILSTDTKLFLVAYIVKDTVTSHMIQVQIFLNDYQIKETLCLITIPFLHKL